MKNYEKPIITLNEELAEGVYAASGCYTVSASCHQAPEDVRADYRIQVDASHNSTPMDGHHSGEQTLTITFNQAVTFVSGAELVSGNNSRVLTVRYHYHNNEVDTLGAGNFYVSAESGLAIDDCKMWCNGSCGQH